MDTKSTLFGATSKAALASTTRGDASVIPATPHVKVTGGTVNEYQHRLVQPLPGAFAYRVNEVPLMGGPHRTKLYALAKEGKLRLVRVAGRTLVDGDSLRDLLRNGCSLGGQRS